MPIFEFRCKVCNKEFEKLILGRSDEVTCPTCDGKDLERLLSSFGFKSSGEFVSSSQTSGCSSCNSTNCSTCS